VPERTGAGAYALIELSDQKNSPGEEARNGGDPWNKAEDIACPGKKSAPIFAGHRLLSCKPRRGSYLFGPPKPGVPAL
jgi:hypothetical protein